MCKQGKSFLQRHTQKDTKKICPPFPNHKRCSLRGMFSRFPALSALFFPHLFPHVGCSTKTHLSQIWLGDVFSLSMDHNRKAYRIDVPLMAWDKPSNLVIICNPIQPGIMRLPTDPKVALSGVTLTRKRDGGMV